jgi:hypothetical protein
MATRESEGSSHIFRIPHPLIPTPRVSGHPHETHALQETVRQYVAHCLDWQPLRAALHKERILGQTPSSSPFLSLELLLLLCGALCAGSYLL